MIIPNNKIVEYTNNAIKFFQAFNGHPEVNPINNSISFFVETRPVNNTQHLAAYNFDNTITLYLYNVLDKILMNNLYSRFIFDNCFYSVMYEAIIHELFHANQKIDMYKYSNNISYNQERIEAPVIAKAHTFMTKYAKQMESYFGFNYLEEVTLMHRRFKDNDTLMNRYIAADIGVILANMINSVCLRNKKNYKELLTIIDQPNLELYISVDNGNTLNRSYPIKSNNAYDQFSLNVLYNDLNMNSRLFQGETNLNIMEVNGITKIIILAYTDNIGKCVPFVMNPTK